MKFVSRKENEILERKVGTSYRNTYVFISRELIKKKIVIIMTF